MNVSSARPLALAGYPIALLLITSSALDTVPKILPAALGSQDWRYGALGLVFNSMVTPLLGLAIAAGTAVFVGHRRTLIALSVIFLISALFAVVGGIMFLVDFGGLSSGLSERVGPSFRVATWKTTIIVALIIPAALWFGIGGFRVARSAGAGPQGSSSSGLVVGQ